MVYNSSKGWTSFLSLTLMLSLIGVGGFLGQTPTAQAVDVWKPMDTQPMTISGREVWLHPARS
ncbi:hypothetical protein ASG89_23125 [Paenibacillus sp. Soil766]|uniref:hypothetical protein n=1 Tax=Paenibacillus sp. Soil766 TaxID=1736404 RepID=UPI0007110118|nr:hypothetical protein [Paenibacillus sp. Soil766]KRF03339.1 hypothetical protein ASG89_23125 [Paenibacillus sp. Soil766]